MTQVMDQPPQLGEIPQTSDFHVPTLATVGDESAPAHASAASPAAATTPAAAHSDKTSSVTTTLDSAKKTAINSELSSRDRKKEDAKTDHHKAAQSAMDAVANHPLTQNVKETVTNGLEQASKTSDEASALAATRKVPDVQTSTGQPLTQYHSFFYSLLTWEHPRVTAISYVGIVMAIFIARYVPLLRLSFKLLSYVLGTTALTEGISQVLLKQSLIAAVRPRRYYTIPREALESTLEDVEQLLNFFVIESQRLVFAEDASKTFAAFLASFMGYWLIKFTPLWGLGLIAITTIYMAPLIYITNKELIDAQLDHASKVVNAQTAQIRDIAATHTANATESLKGYAGDYTAKAQELIGGARRSVSPADPKTKAAGKKSVAASDFPTAPRQEPVPAAPATSPSEPLLAKSEFGGTAVPAS